MPDGNEERRVEDAQDDLIVRAEPHFGMTDPPEPPPSEEESG